MGMHIVNCQCQDNNLDYTEYVGGGLWKLLKKYNACKSEQPKKVCGYVFHAHADPLHVDI